MSKNKKKEKKNPINEFTKLLKKNKKDIIVVKNGEKMSVLEASQESAADSTCCPKEGIIPISSDEAAKKKAVVEFSSEIRYAKTAFTLYEAAMKNIEKQTVVLTLTPEEAWSLFDYGANPVISDLMTRTNISLIMNFMDKQLTKLDKWLNNAKSDFFDVFVLNIPDVILFSGVIQKEAISKSFQFNLCIQIVKTAKSLKKLRKVDPDQYVEVTLGVKEATLENAIALGNSTLHIPINSSFSYHNDPTEDATQWISAINVNENTKKLISLMVFSSENTNDYIMFSEQFVKAITEKTL